MIINEIRKNSGIVSDLKMTTEKKKISDGKIIKALRKAGCKCEKPRIGYKPGKGYKCRLCNKVSDLKNPLLK